MPTSVDTEAALLSDMRDSRKKLEVQVLIADVHASRKTGKALKAAAAKGLVLAEADDEGEGEGEFDVIAVSPGTADSQMSGLVYLLNGDIHHARLAFGGDPAEDLDADAAAQALSTIRAPAEISGSPSAAQGPERAQHPSSPAERAAAPLVGGTVQEVPERPDGAGRERSQSGPPIVIPVPPSMQGEPLTTTELRLGLQTWIRRRVGGDGITTFIAAMSGNQTMRDWIGEQRAVVGELGCFYYSDDSAEPSQRGSSGRQENRVDPSYDGLVVLRGGRRRRKEVIPWDDVPAWFDGCLNDEVKEKLAAAAAAFNLRKQEPGAPPDPDRKKASRALAKAESAVWDLFMAAPAPDPSQYARSRSTFADLGPAQSSLFDAASVPAAAAQASASASTARPGAGGPGDAPGPLIGNDIADALQRIADLSEGSAQNIAEFLASGTPPPPGALTVTGSPGDSVTWTEKELHATVTSPVPGRAGTVSWKHAGRWADTGMTSRDKEILKVAGETLALSSRWAKSGGARRHEEFFRAEAAHAARIIQSHSRSVTDVAANSSGLNPPPGDGPGPKEPRWVTQDKGRLLADLRDRSELAGRVARKIEASAAAGMGENPAYAELSEDSQPVDGDSLTVVPLDRPEVVAAALPPDQPALPSEVKPPERETSVPEPVAATESVSRSASAGHDQDPGAPGSTGSASGPNMPVPSVLGCLTAEEFTALVYAEGGAPGFRDSRFSRPVATKDGVRVVSLTATGTGLSVSSTLEGDALRGAAWTWQQLYAGLTQEHCDLTRSAYRVIAKFEASEDVQDRAAVEAAQNLILEIRDGVASGLGAGPEMTRIREQVDELTTQIAQRQSVKPAVQAEVRSGTEDGRTVQDDDGPVPPSPAESGGEPESGRSRHRPLEEVPMAVPATGPPPEEERDRMSGEENNADGLGPAEPRSESAVPDASYDYVVVREITDSYNDGDLYSYYTPLNRGILHVRQGGAVEEAASRELAGQAAQTDQDSDGVGIRVYRLGEGRKAQPERREYGGYGNVRTVWTEPKPLFTATVAEAQAAVAAASTASSADPPAADSHDDAGRVVPGAQDAVPVEAPEVPAGRPGEAPPDSAPSGPAVYDYVVTRETAESHEDGEVRRYLEEVNRGVLQVPRDSAVEDAAGRELIAQAARAGQDASRVGIRVYPAGEGWKASRKFIADSDGDIEQGWTEPEPLFTTTATEEAFRQVVAALASRPAAAPEGLSDPAADAASADQPTDTSTDADGVVGARVPETARPQQSTGPWFDEATRTLHMGGITIMAGDGPGSYSDDDLRSIAAAFALPRRRPLPPEPLPAVADAVGDAWQPDPALTGGTPVSVYALPVNAVLGSGLRPNRVANADGTQVKFRRHAGRQAGDAPGGGADPAAGERGSAPADDMDADVVQGTACGVIPDRARGWLQAVNTGEAVEFVPLAVVAPAGVNPFEGLNEIQRARASRFDAAEAAGRPAALLSADRLMPGDVIVTGDPAAAQGTWVVAATHTAPDDRRHVIVFPAGRVHPAARLPELGKPYRNAPPGMSGFTLDAASPLVVRLPERHPAEDAPGSAALFSPWIPPRSEADQVSVPDPIADLPLNPEIRAGLGNVLGEAETAGQFFEAANGLLGKMARDWAPGTGGQAAQSPPGDTWLAYGRELEQMQKAAAEAAERSALLRGSRTWRALGQALGNAGRLAKSLGSGAVRVAGGGVDLFRRVCSGLCEAAGSIAFGAARFLPPGRARDAAERLGNRAAGYIARERGFLDRDARLEDGSFSLPDGWTAPSVGHRADVAARLDDFNRENGTDLKLRDLPSPAEAGFTPRPGRRSRVQAQRVRAAAQRPGGQRSGGGPGRP